MTIFDQSEIDALLASAATHGADALEGDDDNKSREANARRKKAPLPAELKRLFKIKVPIIVRLSERDMSFEDVLGLTPGAIIEFETTCDADLQLVVGNQVIGAGQAVKVGENFGLRITKMADMSNRIVAMGGDG